MFITLALFSFHFFELILGLNIVRFFNSSINHKKNKKMKKMANFMAVISIWCAAASVWILNSNEEKISKHSNIADLEITESNGFGKMSFSSAEEEDVEVKGTIITSNGVISFDGTNSVGKFTPME